MNERLYEWISLFNENIRILGAYWTLWKDCNELRIIDKIC
jgi:hypothetical protein